MLAMRGLRRLNREKQIEKSQMLDDISQNKWGTE